LYRIGGRAHAHGITFESDWGRVYAADNGRDTVRPFSARTREIKAALRKVPLLRVFPAFGKAGTAIFVLLAALLLTEAFAPEVLYFEFYMPDALFYGLVSGAVALLFIVLLVLRKRIRRTLQYHGAEHMAINTYRAGKALTAENIARADRATASCGSVFVLVFLIVGVPLMFVPYSDYFLPVTLGVAFELAVLARRVKWLRWLLRFGMWAQRRIWTRQPDAAQIEIAQRGLCTLIELMDGETKGVNRRDAQGGRPLHGLLVGAAALSRPLRNFHHHRFNVISYPHLALR
jgi:uncharacterized protein YqhQ